LKRRPGAGSVIVTPASTEAFSPTATGLRFFTVSVTVATLDVAVPSDARYVNESGPT
jgi:hypothetical protein